MPVRLPLSGPAQDMVDAMNIAILGTGRVGSALAHAIVLKQLCDHLMIAGRSMSKARGDALD
ncbi:MAG: hypothetical protein LUO80_06135, partial [Methylococcaceae bacterium]|nr:hypothetical protein [Methylococcaceae bacterium]